MQLMISMSAALAAKSAFVRIQVMRMGEPITAVSLAPAMDLLATTHVGRRGIYLWSNQLLFGTGVPPAHSDRPVDARLPAITPGGCHSMLIFWIANIPDMYRGLCRTKFRL